MLGPRITESDKASQRLQKKIKAVRDNAEAVLKGLRSKIKMEIDMLTVEKADELLKHNSWNRPLSEQHAQRISRAITEGRWRFNGETIKIARGGERHEEVDAAGKGNGKWRTAKEGDILDGQHRCFAVIYSGIPVPTIIVYGIEHDAFSTIDTISKARSGGDTIALCKVGRYRPSVATALTWLIRWQRGIITDFKAPQNRIENYHIEEAHASHSAIMHAVEVAHTARGIVNPGLLAFLYYIIDNHDHEVAERFIKTLVDPAGFGMTDPFYRLRATFLSRTYDRKNTLLTIALTIKAANAAHQGQKLQSLQWRQGGKSPEPFPALEF